MKLMQVAKALFAGSVTILFVGAAPGCGATAEGYCNKRCDCVPCTETERSLCVSLVEDSRTSAKGLGCESEFEAYFSCLNSETACVAGRIDDDGCEAELDVASKCGVFLGNACDKYASDLVAKYSECGITGTGGSGGETECNDTLAKLASCYDACLPTLDCTCLLDPSANGCAEKLNVYAACVTACQ